MQAVDEDRLVDESREDLALDILARLKFQLDWGAGEAAPICHIHPPHQIRHPSDVVLCRNNFQSWKAFQHPAQNEHHDRSFDLMMQGAGPHHKILREEIYSCSPAASENMKRQRQVEVLGRRPERIVIPMTVGTV